jgi:uncharacterized protein (DUF697 family)/GTP-binding protein EngB required for normal cell division
MKQDQFQQRLEAELAAFKKDISRPNILLAGATGVGKSSLVNLCFGSELAKVGIGAPVTQQISSYSHPDVSVTLFDTKGYEVGSTQEAEFLQEVIAYAADKNLPAARQIHIVWYCVSAPGSRITDFDVMAVTKMRDAGLPVALVMTKADLVSTEDAQGFRQAISQVLPRDPVFESSTRSDLGGFDLDRLLQWSVANLDDSLKVGFVAAQKRNIALKRAEADKVIAQHCVISGGIGAAPIPFSDAPLLLTNQAGMLGRILYIYGLESLATTLGPAVTSAAGGPMLAQAGILIAGSLLKAIPGVGSIVGGTINATVAATLTFAVGKACSELCALLYTRALAGDSATLKAIMDTAVQFLTDEIVRQMKKTR